ncbi:MAG: ribonuclease H-like domain-containing protein [Chloroflexi bacterium]|nr:ribonuclease H-like domain-containing protein [Chloroflexota bacterium]
MTQALDPAARASALAAAVPGVTLGRRLASFRAARGAGVRDAEAGGGAGDHAHRLAAAVGGTVVPRPGGRVVRVDAGSARIPVDRRRLGGLPGQPPPDRRLVCLDTETTGLGTGAGTLAWIVGIGTWDGEALRVVQLLLPDHPDEPALLDAIAEEVGEAPVLVTYNGRSFDWPLLVARYRLHGRRAPVLGGHLDLLPVARRLFRHRLGGARLRTVEEGILGVVRHDDVEGWEIPALYLDFLRGATAAPLSRVARHNAEDVLSLGRLLAHLDERFADPVARPAAHPGDLASLAEMLRRDGRHDEALACLDHATKTLRSRPSPDPWTGPWRGMPAASGTEPVPADVAAYASDPAASAAQLAAERSPWWSPRVRPDLGGRAPAPVRGPAGAGSRRDEPVDLAGVLAARARTLRRLGRHADAAAAWEELATVAGSAGAAAWIEVAKIREHAERDASGALAATDRALALLARSRAAGRPDHGAEGRASRRHARLARRVARQSGTVRTVRG